MRLWFGLTALIGSAQFALASISALADTPTKVTVYAGSGRAGFRDGPAATAQFILPSALAVDPQGNLYVTDAAAQRVRVVRTDGSVRTIAGSGSLMSSGLWVDPGFKDGPALQAQFNRPSGIAVSTNGQIYIADTNNHCIRAISASIVSTYAGICGTLGTQDGPRAGATFSYPRQLSFDANGNLYVADFGNGVRKIDAAGTVSTLSMAVDKRVTGVQAGYQFLWVADALGLLKYDVQTGLATRLPSYYESHDFPPPTAGDVELGTPYALADDVATEDVYYTDLRSDTVRRFRSTLASIEHLSGVPREDAVIGNGWMTSGLHGPMGIALDRHGGLFVADSGHKRIMRITGFDRGLHVLVDAFKLLQQNITPSDYPILIIGNSFTYFNSTARDSIGSLLEQMLRSDRALGSRSPKVVSFSEPGLITGQPSLAREIISKSSFKFVLIIANANDFWGVAPDVAGQLALWHKQEADTVEALKAASIPSMFVLIPEHWMVSPLEVLFGREVVMPVESDYGAFEPLMLGALQGTGAPVLNLFPAMHAYEASPFVKPLYANEDLHPSLAGRVFIATQIARRLEQLKPWGAPRAVH